MAPGTSTAASFAGITLKKAYTDGTVAVDMDPLSLLCRLATSVPPPRFHTVRYAGVLAAASLWRPTIAPTPPTEEPAATSAEPDRTGPAGGYRPWAELLARTFAVDVLACPKCHGRMRLLAMVQEPANVARFLAALGAGDRVAGSRTGDGPRGGRGLRLEPDRGHRHSPVKVQRPSPGPAGVGERPQWTAPRRGRGGLLTSGPVSDYLRATYAPGVR